MLRWLEDPIVLEALWLASPDLVEALPAWRNDPEGSKGRRVALSLYRYLARMTSRATPFGLFAANSLGKVGSATHLELGARDQYRRRSRLDMEGLAALTQAMVEDLERRRNLHFRPNSSLHWVAGTYHHLSGNLKDGAGTYHLLATEPNVAIDATLRRATGGATFVNLAAALRLANPEVQPEEVEAFLTTLIESQMLVPDLMPPVTGQEALPYMIGRLEEAAQPEFARELREVGQGLEALDREALGTEGRTYQQVLEKLDRLPGAFAPGRALQVDLVKPAPKASLDPSCMASIARGVELLHSIQGFREQTVFRRFKEDFLARYQDREIPLLEALDDEAGIGFESEDNAGIEPLLDGLHFSQEEPSQERPFSPMLLRRLETLWREKGTILHLDAELLEDLKVPDPLPLPDALAAMGVAFQGATGTIGFVLHSVLGPSGVNLIARFCHADPELTEWVAAHLREEEAHLPEQAVFAEIAHLPEGRVGNVVTRPALRTFEIPFLATSGVPEDRQLPPSDLLVSIRGDRIVLRSQRLLCEVHPRMTSAHNFLSDRALKPYKFLCLLQHQNVSTDLTWDWGGLYKAAFLPRVVAGDIVLSLARWRIMGAGAWSAAQVETWHRENGVPRYVFVAEGDHRLLIDLDNAFSVEVLLNHLHQNPETLLVEMFPPPEGLLAHGPEGRFVHELVVPFVRKKVSISVEPAGRRRPTTAVASCPPGSEWLYAKLFCSLSHADRLLSDLVAPLVDEMTQAGLVDRWFFIRYEDPRWHLRLRLHGNPSELYGKVLPHLAKRVEGARSLGTLWRLELDTYDREVERYGGSQGMDVAEQLFHLDSELSLSLLPWVAAADDPQLRWRLAFWGMDCLLTGLGFPLEVKLALARRMTEARAGGRVRSRIASRFREERPTLLATLSGRLPFQSEVTSAFARYAAGLVPLREALMSLQASGALGHSIDVLAEHFVHMHLNRMLRSSHLAQETVLWEFLARTYETLRRGLTDA